MVTEPIVRTTERRPETLHDPEQGALSAAAVPVYQRVHTRRHLHTQICKENNGSHCVHNVFTPDANCRLNSANRTCSHCVHTKQKCSHCVRTIQKCSHCVHTICMLNSANRIMVHTVTMVHTEFTRKLNSANRTMVHTVFTPDTICILNSANRTMVHTVFTPDTICKLNSANRTMVHTVFTPDTICILNSANRTTEKILREVSTICGQDHGTAIFLRLFQKGTLPFPSPRNCIANGNKYT